MSKSYKRQNRRTVDVETTAGGAKTSDFNPDYTYVRKDLRKIGILAGSFFVILVILAFILPNYLH